MLTCLTLALAIGAPVPRDEAPVPAGPVPRLLDVKPAADGEVTVPVTRAEKAAAGIVMIGINGNPNGGQIQFQQDVTTSSAVPLSEVKDLKVYTADGKEVTIADAAKRLTKGGTVVVSADGKKVDPRHLKVFRDDAIVLVSPEKVGPAGRAGQGIGNLVMPNLQFQIVPAAPAVPAAPPAGGK